METLFFILMLACLGLVLFWYIGNEANGGRGGRGLLSIRDDEGSGPAKPSYKTKKRLRPHSGGASDAQTAPAFAARAADGYNEKDEAGYRATDSLPRYAEKPRREPGVS